MIWFLRVKINCIIQIARVFPIGSFSAPPLLTSTRSHRYCSMHILETRDLVHSFSKDEIVLDGISLCVEEGSIYGFLGPNGAGKTTTLRLVLGLLKKQQGSIEIFGKDFEKHRVASLRKIGSLIESPSIYSHLTAVENLRLLQKIYQCPRARID